MILVGREYWRGLLHWLREQAVERGYLSAADLDLLKLTDDPAEVMAHITRFYDEQAMDLSAPE